MTSRINMFALAATALVIGLAGCQQDQPTTKPSSAYDRSENALHDPFHYSPGIEKPDMDRDIGSSDSLKKDWDHVINP